MPYHNRVVSPPTVVAPSPTGRMPASSLLQPDEHGPIRVGREDGAIANCYVDPAQKLGSIGGVDDGGLVEAPTRDEVGLRLVAREKARRDDVQGSRPTSTLRTDSCEAPSSVLQASG